MHPVENLYHHRDQIGRFLKFLVTNLVEKLYGDFWATVITAVDIFGLLLEKITSGHTATMILILPSFPSPCQYILL